MEVISSTLQSLISDVETRASEEDVVADVDSDRHESEQSDVINEVLENILISVEKQSRHLSAPPDEISLHNDEDPST